MAVLGWSVCQQRGLAQSNNLLVVRIKQGINQITYLVTLQ
jgi:hypothetical protein